MHLLCRVRIAFFMTQLHAIHTYLQYVAHEYIPSTVIWDILWAVYGPKRKRMLYIRQGWLCSFWLTDCWEIAWNISPYSCNEMIVVCIKDLYTNRVYTFCRHKVAFACTKLHNWLLCSDIIWTCVRVHSTWEKLDIARTLNFHANVYVYILG